MGDWNHVTVLMAGLQNTTDSLSFLVGQLGRFIDPKINAVTKKRHYLLTCSGGKYCLLALHGSIVV